jgi:hypothetical protein
MKCKSNLQRWLVAGAVGLSLSGWTLSGRAQPFTNYIIDQFDTDTSAEYSDQYWGTTVPAFSWNTNNATPMAGLPNNPGSGSLEWQSAWAIASGDQIMVVRGFNSISSSGDNLNFNDYTNLSFDIQFLTNCATDGNGSYGYIEVDAVPQADGWPSTFINGYSSEVANGNGWIHVSLPINTQGNSKLSIVTGIGMKLQQNKTGTPLTGTTDFLIDNLVLGGNSVAPPPPTLTIGPVTTPPGLLIIAAGGGNQYNRAELEATDPVNGPNFSWVSASGPVTYSMTIVGYPDTNHSGFESEIFLVPNGNNADPAIDYDAANVAQMTIFNNADGSATASFQYKTNDADDNSGFSSYGNLASITVPGGPLGTWSITFLDDTNVTLTCPNGASTNVNFPDESTAQVFANPLNAYFGNQQGGTTGNIGQGSTYSQFSITGTPVAASFTDVFTNDAGVINASHWINDDPTAPNNILIVQPTDAFWVSWTLPSAGYNLLSSPTLGPGAVWSATGLNNIVTTTQNSQVLIPQSSLPAPGQGFFRLGKPTQ